MARAPSGELPRNPYVFVGTLRLQGHSRSVGLFLLGWIGLLFGWNLGVAGFWAAIALFLALAAVAVRSEMRGRPELAAAIAARTPGQRRWRLVASAAIGFVALVVLTYAFVGAWERNARDYVPSERGLIALPPGDRGLAESLLAQAGLEVPAGVDLTSGRVFRLDREFGALDAPALGLFLAASLLGGLALLAWAGARPRGVPGLQIVRAAIEPLLAAAFALFVVCAATHLVGYATSANVVRDVEHVATIPGAPDAAEPALRGALIERGFRVYAEVHGRISADHGRQVRADVVRLRACDPVPRERWELGARGPIRLTPDLLLTLVGDPRGERTSLRVQAGALDESSPRHAEWSAWLRELVRELDALPAGQ